MIYEKRHAIVPFFVCVRMRAAAKIICSIRTFHLLKGFLAGNHKVARWRLYINYCYA